MINNKLSHIIIAHALKQIIKHPPSTYTIKPHKMLQEVIISKQF